MDTSDDTPLEWRQLRRDRVIQSDAFQGLRERKKRLMRQLISDTATFMFLERGFDEVRVSEVAAACDVSEKTVYNYFPSKESLLFDREEESNEAFRRALGPEGPDVSPVEAAVGVLAGELDEMFTHLGPDSAGALPALLAFNDLIEHTPALRAYRTDMIERSAQIAAEAMALRAGVNPHDPEPQIAGDALVGLWRVFYRSLVKNATGSPTPGELREEVMGDVRRAARLIDTGLWSFSTVVQGASGREQFKAAADASNEARKQVLAAVKQARDAWRTLTDDMEARVRDEVESAQRSSTATRRAAHQRAVREANELRRQIHLEKQEMKQEIKETIKRARRTGRPGS